MKACIKGLEVKVLNSPAGYYIGTLITEDGFTEPNCRVSVCYYKDESLAQKELDDLIFTQREFAPEVQFCNDGRTDGCCIRERNKK